ncbi:MAG: ribonucleotide-diphosphate reductase subunit beta [Patescibacteria group bacterium]
MPAKPVGLFNPRKVYRPFEYPHFYEYFQKQQQAHWLPTEVPMESDIADYRFRLSESEKYLIIQILRFFTQGDIEVNNNYNQHLIPAFPKPEIKMMLSAFASTETIHVWAYSYLNDSLGLPEREYSAFLDYQSMRNKYEYLQQFKAGTTAELALNMAVFGGFMEGVNLFASFAILMNFPRLGKMKGVGQIITWSIRDETLHSKGVCHLFRDLIAENRNIWTDSFRSEIYKRCDEMVGLEDAFIDTCFGLGEVPGLTPGEVKQYIRYIADRRLHDLGLDAKYLVSNPLEWLDTMINAKEHTNFFENRATEYSKGAVVDDWT